MDVTLSLKNKWIINTIALLFVISLLLIPSQAAALGHDSRLMAVAGETEMSGFAASRIESPDLYIARVSAERLYVEPFIRIESPDMLLARTVSIETSVAAPVNILFGINIWAALLLLVLVTGLLLTLVTWERLFPIKDRDIARVTSRCSLVNESC